MPPDTRFSLHCPRCGFREVLNGDGAVERLQQSGVLRRARDADPALIAELLRNRASQWSCSKCQAAGLGVELVSGHAHVDGHPHDTGDEDAGWERSRRCAGCRKLIPSERLEIFPQARYCAACEARPPKEEPHFCLRCGSVLEVVRSRRSGIARYVFECPVCRS